MKEITIHFHTDDTYRHMDRVDQFLSDIAEKHDGECVGCSLENGKRALRFDFQASENTKPFFKEVSKNIRDFKSQIPGLKIILIETSGHEN